MSNKRLYKSTVNCMLCGVCGGIAEYFDIDPTLVRLAWVILTCFGGAGIWAYIIAAIIIPKEAYEGYKGHYIKYAMRNAMDIATTGCSVNVKLSEDKKTMEDVRIAYGVAGPVPMRAPSAEAKAKGKPTTKAAIREFAKAVLEDINPRDSWRAAKDFRQHIAVVLAERALTESIRLAGGEINE